ncbi:MAG TPA: GNAT family N-acetyltransferase [Candidatus Eisenbacteria bacterium]|nr:GNAT family N-acetyltransferase [Candidatus Eisenbacteria bacterium]
MLPAQLVEMALRPWGRPRVGLVLHPTPERIVELDPNFPIPGPNHVGQIRCAPERVAPVVDGTRELARSYGLRCLWILDPDARPPDLPARLAACGIVPAGDVAVMVLPATAELARGSARVEIADALADLGTFAAAEAVQAAAFGSGPAPRQEARFGDGRDEPSRHFFLALLDGEPAGAAWATVRREGVLMNGGAVAPRFQGRGVYRALLAERLALARRAGAAGVAAWARPETSAPILARLGFTEVGRNRLYRDESA